MQNRRIPADDQRGMGEYLEENDQFGNGIRVPASYYVQIFDSKFRSSNQRMMQLKVESPATHFYNFKSVSQVTPTLKDTLSQDLKNSGIEGSIKLVTMPLAKNKILARIENVADLYDGKQESKMVKTSFAQALLKSGNVQPQDMDVQFRELSLTGNMDIKEMLDRKIHWRTMDDATDG